MVSFTCFSQEDTIRKEDNNGHLSLYTTASFGKDYYGKSYTTNSLGMDYCKQLNDKLRLRVGADILTIQGNSRLIDRRPRKNKDASLYVGMDYKVNDKMMLSGTVFFNTIYSTLGANLNMQYKFNEDTFLDVSFTYIRTNAPYDQYSLYPPMFIR